MENAERSGMILVGGMMRSGTTLLQRVLDIHPEITLAYQTNTSAFIDLKKRFLSTNNISSYHVLWHYGQSGNYTFTQFQQWLSQQKDLQKLISGSMEITRTKWSGVKEVLVEEFYPALTKQGISCLNLIRDPRDIIASMSFGHGAEYTGKKRPVLFDLRNWRKSVHIAYHLRNEAFFKNILFEDLILNKDTALESIYSWLSIEPMKTRDIESLLNHSQWRGNSSFGVKKAFDTAAVNNYQAVLAPEVTDYIEAVCWPEMTHLGYTTRIQANERQSIISSYADPFTVSRPEFSSDYSSCDANIAFELERLNKGFFELNREFVS